MISQEIFKGRVYGVRLNTMRKDELIKVKVLESVGRGGKHLVQHVTGSHPGLEEYLHSRQFVCAWKDAKALVRDEKRHLELLEITRSQGDNARCEATEHVFYATGERDGYFLANNTFLIGCEALARIMGRAGFDMTLEELDPDGYVDREGRVHMSFNGAERLARAFAAANPETVTLYLEAEEREMLAKGWGKDSRFYHDQLLEAGPPFALIRQWAGFEAEISLLRDEIKRLQEIVRTAVYELRRAGAEIQAIRLERSLRGE